MNEELSYDDFVYCRFEVNRIGERLNIKALDHFQEARDSYLPILPTAKWFTAPSTLAWGRSSDSPLSAFWFRYSPECWSINFSGMYPSSATDWPFSLSLSLSASLCFSLFLSFFPSFFILLTRFWFRSARSVSAISNITVNFCVMRPGWWLDQFLSQESRRILKASPEEPCKRIPSNISPSFPEMHADTHTHTHPKSRTYPQRNPTWIYRYI